MSPSANLNRFSCRKCFVDGPKCALVVAARCLLRNVSIAQAVLGDIDLNIKAVMDLNLFAVWWLIFSFFLYIPEFHGIQASFGPSVWKQRRALRTLHDHRPLLCHKVSAHARSSVATETEICTNNFCFWACDRIRPPYQRLPSGHQRWHPCLRPRSRNPAMVRCQKNTFWIAALRPLKTDLLCTIVQPWIFVKMIPCRQTISPAPVVWHFLGTFDFGTGPQHSTKNWIHFHDAPNFNDFVRVWLWIGNSQLNTTSGSQLYKCIKIFTTPHVANLHMAHFPDTKSRHWQWFNFNHAFQIISICCDAASGAIDLSSVLQLKTLAASMLQVEESNDWTISWSKTGPAQRQQREFQNEMLFENQHGVDTAGLFSHVSTLLGRHGYSTVLFPPGKQVTFECMNFCIWYFGFKSEQF